MLFTIARQLHVSKDSATLTYNLTKFRHVASHYNKLTLSRFITENRLNKYKGILHQLGFKESKLFWLVLDDGQIDFRIEFQR